MMIQPSAFSRVVTCSSLFLESPEDGKQPARSGVGDDSLLAKVSDDQCSTTSSTTSSIGRNSDLSSERSMGDEDCGENEAQSTYKGPLDMMDSLEEVLPIRRGISKFYNGKSKSFTSLADASSCKEIAKPENGYTRRRRNLMAFNHVWDKNRNFPLRSNSGGISKRTISSSRSALALAFAIDRSDSSRSLSEDSNSSSNSRSPPPLPPLHPRSRMSATSAGPSSPHQQNFSAWCSFSLADLQHCATAATVKMPSCCLRNDTAQTKLT
ncbi:hypothetical protein L6164_015639 [Bauhinia variegata]|uniref:Uncharacterized protein n=1 Tax=Bauhinia variegata TaxID=167791 RepID=A0ACB9NL94_BAUVA|nr:hypothetical protein L6164_015639 [Bauhinia variegata]